MTREQNRKSAMKRIELEIAARTTFPAVTRSDNYVIPDRNILSTYFLTVFNPSRSPFSLSLWLFCGRTIQSGGGDSTQSLPVNSTCVRIYASSRIFIEIRVVVVGQHVNFVYERVTRNPLFNQLHMNDRKIDTRSQFSTYELGIDTRRFHLPSKSRGHLLRGQHTFASTRRGSTFPDSRTTRDIRCSRSREPPLSATRPLVYLQDKIERAFDKAATWNRL